MAKEKITAVLDNEKVITENSNEARELYNQSRYGSLMQSGKVQLSLLEALYLSKKDKIKVFDKKNKEISFGSLMKKAKRTDKRISIRYAVFEDFRERGYVIKTALKFGADFRVYARGVKPGEDHAKWIVYPAHESESLTWYEFAAKNRVAHSTKKRLMMGVVDDEGDVSYWEIKWVKP
ncbi:tRNA-intron lyase [Candidatus Woesearchaeota archaeon]|nr:tRNA-intron lyase [Candidatus Woesearchaeota archaeon]